MMEVGAVFVILTLYLEEAVTVMGRAEAGRKRTAGSRLVVGMTTLVAVREIGDGIVVEASVSVSSPKLLAGTLKVEVEVVLEMSEAEFDPVGLKVSMEVRDSHLSVELSTE